MPSIERPDPPYQQVAAALRRDITDGALAVGDTVPSARAIAAEWGVSLATAQRALRVLADEGLVVGRTGAGTVVTSRTATHRTAQDATLAMHRTGRIYPSGNYARISSAELVQPSPERLALVFGLTADDALIRRQRITYGEDDCPVSTSVSWFDGTLAATCPRLLAAERIIAGTVGYIAEQTGREVRSGADWFTAGSADDEAAGALALEVGAAVLLATNRWYDQDERVLELGESVSPAGRWAYYPYTVNEGTA